MTFDLYADVGKMVYVKAIAVETLPRKIQENANGLDVLFAVHDSEGQQLALVADRKLAIALAKQNDYAPQPIH